MPKVSIVLPSLNVASYIDECLHSVVNQTLRDIEVLCVDAGSTDGTKEIIQKYAEQDSRVHLVESSMKSYGHQMNLGIDNATGEYIGIVETDDFVRLSMFEELYEVASANNLDFVKADFYRFKRDEKSGDMTLTYVRLDPTKEWYGKLFDPSTEPKALRFEMNTWAGIYRRDFLSAHSIRHNETPGASYQDNGFHFQTFTRGKRAMIVNAPYYFCRRDNPNSSVFSTGKIHAVDTEYAFIRSKLEESPEVWERFKYMYTRKLYDNYCFTLGRIANEHKLDYVNHMRDVLDKAMSDGELSWDTFSENEASNIKLLLADPYSFYYKRCLEPQASRRVKQLDEEIHRIHGSWSYRIGRAITALPRAVRAALRRLR